MEPLGADLTGKRVLVTGATGLVGGALAERLAGLGAEVTGAGRRLDRAEWLEGLGVHLAPMDLTDPTAWGAALEGRQVVFAVAAWTGRDDEDKARRVNVEAPAALVRAAAEAGVVRVVHVSTAGVYGLPAADRVTEDTPVDTAQSATYERSKALGEERVRAAAGEAGIELVVVRPGMVYGPRSRAWTVGMLKLVKNGTPVLLGDSSGNCFPVYIDNLVDGLLLAATVPAAAGEVFHLVDEPVPWERWFGHFGAMCGRKPRRLPGLVAKPLALLAEKLPLGLPLSRSRLAFLSRKLEFPTDRAREVLGWTPGVDLEEGMRRSEAWLREQGRL
jgi:nucleoside-diphosphate-sugar epimerase